MHLMLTVYIKISDFQAICYLVTERLNPTVINEAKTAEQTQKVICP